MSNLPRVPPQLIAELQKQLAYDAVKKKSARDKYKNALQQAMLSAISGMQINGWVDVYTNQVPYELDVLRGSLYQKTDLGFFIQAVLGVGVGNQLFAVDFACAPVTPPGMSVTVGPGVIYYFDVLLPVAYSVIPVDTNPDHQIYKSYINPTTQTFATPAPSTAGQSIIYLIQGAHQTTTANVVSRPYFNDADPSMPIFESQPDTLLDYTLLGVKPGVAGTSPTAPTPDAGYTPLYYVTVAYGQTSVVSGNITLASGAPFITESLTQKISSATVTGNFVTKAQEQQSGNVYALDLSVTANAVVANPSPTYATPGNGTRVLVKVANTNTGPSTLNINSMGPLPIRIIDPSGLIALSGGEMPATGIFEFIYNTSFTGWQLNNPSAADAPISSPVFAQVYLAADVVFAPGNNIVPFGGVIQDNTGIFTASTFRPKIAGTYRLNFFQAVAVTGALSGYYSTLNFNGSPIQFGYINSISNSTSQGVINISKEWTANGSTDYFSINTSNSSTSGTLEGGTVNSNFSIELIG